MLCSPSVTRCAEPGKCFLTSEVLGAGEAWRSGQAPDRSSWEQGRDHPCWTSGPQVKAGRIIVQAGMRRLREGTGHPRTTDGNRGTWRIPASTHLPWGPQVLPLSPMVPESPRARMSPKRDVCLRLQCRG